MRYIAQTIVFLSLAAVAFLASADGPFEKPPQQPVFVPTKKSDDEFSRAAAEARRTLPAFRTLLKRPMKEAMPLVKKRFENGRNAVYLWSLIVKVEPDGFITETFEAPQAFPELKAGTQLFIKNADVVDWMLIDNGTMHGGYTSRLQRSRLPEDQRENFDNYVGARQYAPLPP
jgi:uncharacterized protein YegJ (DUF2314 family)